MMFNKITNPMIRQYAVVIAANFPIISLGMHNVWGSPMLIKLKDENQTVLSRPITPTEEAWLNTIGGVGGLVALFFTGWLMDSIGRKRSLCISIMPKLTMCMFLIFANEAWMVLVGRAIGALGDMTLISVVSTYCSEVAGKEIRGASGTMTQIMSAIGMLIMFGVGPFVSYITINVVMTCITVAVYVPLLFVPESPYFLAAKGKTNNAVEVLTNLRGTKESAYDEISQFSIQKVSKENLDHKNNESSKNINTEINDSKWSLLKDKTVLKTLAIIILLCIGQQMIGYNAVNYFLQSIFEISNTNVSPEISSLAIGCIQLLACVITFFITDRFGRKPILCISLIGIGIGMIGLGTFFQISHGTDEIIGFLNYIPIISVAFVIYGFNAGLGSLFWMLIAELLDGPLRPYGVSMAVIITVVAMSILTLFFPTIMSGAGILIVWWVFAVFCFITCLFIALIIPETKGKTFVEIQRCLGKTDSEISSK